MKRENIIEAYYFLLKHTTNIPVDAIYFMKDASLSVFDSLSDDDYCKKCHLAGKQMYSPVDCEGCGNNMENTFCFKNNIKKFRNIKKPEKL